jgi:aspartate/methionine/tyrosine aminotransferase
VARGFGLVPQPVAGAMLKLQSHSTSNPTSISQKAAVEALRAAGIGADHARGIP